ncbi:hypothetical protein BGZ82_007401, partial [Podila clonocystis]
TNVHPLQDKFRCSIAHIWYEWRLSLGTTASSSSLVRCYTCVDSTCRVVTPAGITQSSGRPCSSSLNRTGSRANKVSQLEPIVSGMHDMSIRNL